MRSNVETASPAQYWVRANRHRTTDDLHSTGRESARNDHDDPHWVLTADGQRGIGDYRLTDHGEDALRALAGEL